MNLKLKGLQNVSLFFVIFNVCVSKVKTDPVSVTPGSGEYSDSQEDQEDEENTETGGIDTDEDYAKFVVTALLFLVVLGPPVIYYFAHFYSKRNLGFLRVTSLFYWVFFWIFMPFMITCTTRKCGSYSKTQHTLDIFGFILMPIFWVVMMVESWISKERFHIAKLRFTEPVKKYIDRLKNEQPRIVWTAKCYHYESSPSEVAYIDSEGDTQYQKQSLRKKVVTHEDSEEFRFAYWSDKSEDIMNVTGKCLMIRLRLTKDISPGDTETTETLNRMKEEFKSRNRDRDKFVDFADEKILPGFEATMTAYTDECCGTCWVGEPQFWVASLLALTWPYRWLFRLRMHRAFFTIKKKLYISRPVGSENKSDIRAYKAQVAEQTNVDVDSNGFTAISIDTDIQESAFLY